MAFELGLMPLGGDEMNSGYKGYGLAMFVELICGLMSGSKYAHQVSCLGISTCRINATWKTESRFHSYYLFFED